MQRFTSSKRITEITHEIRLSGQQIGFIPTMGALHDGHLSLVRRSLAENDITICSIFVNPTQFNEPDDFNSYPRNIEADAKMLESVGCDILFAPIASEIYPVPDLTIYELGKVANELEGSHRPGHFNGVASVVKRLFEITQPHKAYFGLKDYQQYLVIRTLSENYNLKVDVIGCEIVRSNSGLALSSRNALLSDSNSINAKILFKGLEKAKTLLQQGFSIDSILEQIEVFYGETGGDLEYFEIRKKDDLSIPASGQTQGLIALVAARFGEVRLIDNLILN